MNFSKEEIMGSNDYMNQMNHLRQWTPLLILKDRHLTRKQKLENQ